MKGFRSLKVPPSFPHCQRSNVTNCVKYHQIQEEAEDFFSTYHPTSLNFLPPPPHSFLCSCCLCPLIYLFISVAVPIGNIFLKSPKDYIASASVMFSSLAEIKMSQSQKRDVVGRQVSLGGLPHFSSYLMDQVFLQDFLTTVETPHQLCI